MDKEIRKILKPVAALLLLMLVSTMVFFVLARWEGRSVSLLDCLYMVTITISTIGYEDVLQARESVVLSVFTIVTILGYMVVVAYTVSNLTAFLVEGRLKRYFQLKKYLKRISKMDGHYIICGIKDIGVYAAHELSQTKREFVVIDENRHAVESLRQEIPSLVALEGDATDDHLLLQAGIKKAKALIACLDNDKENLYLVLAAKELNREVEVAAKYNSSKTRKKLLNAGASYLVSPYMIGGLRIASELIRPQVVSFLDRMLRGKVESGVRVEDVKICEGSVYVGKRLGDILAEKEILIISYYDPAQDDFVYNPSMETKILAGMSLIFIAGPEKRRALEEESGGES